MHLALKHTKSTMDGHFVSLRFAYSFDPAYSETLDDYFRTYRNCFDCTFNAIRRGDVKTTAQSTVFQKTLNAVPKESVLRQAAYLDAEALHERTGDAPKVVFGGRKLFAQRARGLLTHDEFVRLRTRPISVSGDALKAGGNYVFKLVSSTEVDFCPNRDVRVPLTIKNDRKGNKKLLEDLGFALDEGKPVPVSYKLGRDFLSVTFDVLKVKEVAKRRVVPDRVFAIDTNPNYLGWSVVDWRDSDTYGVVASGYVSLKPLNDMEYEFKRKRLPSTSPERKYATNKRHEEVTKLARDLVTKARHFGCETFAFEKLSMKPGDKDKGRNYNKLCNNLWQRNTLFDQVDKLCKLDGIVPQPVLPEYSSFVGNLVFRQEGLPDFVLASIEISRRGYEFVGQYLKKTLKVQKNVVFNDSKEAHGRAARSLEELGRSFAFVGFRDLYKKIKKTKTRVRFRLEDVVAGRALFSHLDRRKKTVNVVFRRSRGKAACA